MLEVNGFEVYDLGIDQPEANFVKRGGRAHPQVLALSGFLSVAFDSMKSTIEQVEAAGLRKEVKVIIGGGQMDETVRKLHRGRRLRGRRHGCRCIRQERRWG